MSPSDTSFSSSENSYEDQMKIIRHHAGAVFLQLRLDHIRYLKGDGAAASVLSYLLNLLRMKDTNSRDKELLKENGMWFRCPAANICDELGMSDEREHRAITTLEEKKIIRTKKRKGNFLWVKMKTSKLEEIEEADKIRERRNPRKADSISAKSGFPGNPRKADLESPQNNTKTPKITERNGHTEKSLIISSKKHSKNSRPLSRDGKVCMEMSDQFYDAVDSWMKNERIGGCKPSRLKGPYWFSRTIKKHGLEMTEEVLAWTLKNLNDPFVPEVRAAETFYKKFDRLVLAKHRTEQKKKESTKRNELPDDRKWC